MNCEICGRPISGAPKKITLERATLTVCTECAKYGKPASTSRKPFMIKRQLSKPRGKNDLLRQIDLTEGYGSLIKTSREAMGLSREAFAKMLNEKESVVRRIEAEEMRPTIDLARKIEKALKIKLLKPAQEEHLLPPSHKTSLTFGDVAVLRKREKLE